MSIINRMRTRRTNGPVLSRRRPAKKKWGRLAGLTCLGILAGGVLFVQSAAASPCCTCIALAALATRAAIVAFHADTRSYVSDEMKKEQEWWIDEVMEGHVRPALQRMTRTFVTLQKLVTVDYYKMTDVENLLETSQTYGLKQAEIHKKFQSSQELCEIGTLVGGLAAAREISRGTTLSMSEYGIKRDLFDAGAVSAEGRDEDMAARLEQFKTTYCDPRAQNFALEQVCGEGGPPARRNRDIHYAMMADIPKTLDVSAVGAADPEGGEEYLEDLQALEVNLFGSEVLWPIEDLEGNEKKHEKLLSIAAARSVARNSYWRQVGLKAAGPPNRREFMAAVLKELGAEDDAINAYMSKNPSFYERLDVLAKKYLQKPGFYIGLNDKPGNLVRKSAALDMIKLMIRGERKKTREASSATAAVWLMTELNAAQDRVENK